MRTTALCAMEYNAFLMEFAIQAGYGGGDALKMENELENIVRCLKTAHWKLGYRPAKAAAFWSLPLKSRRLPRKKTAWGGGGAARDGHM